MERGSRYWFVTTAIVTLIVFLAACGTAPGGNGNGNGNGEVTTGVRDVGFVLVDETTGDAGTGQVSGSGFFMRFDDDLPDAFFDGTWSEGVGTCDVVGLFDVDPGDPIDLLPVPTLPDDLGIAFLDAGASIAVRTSGSAYLELERDVMTSEDLTFISYASADAITGSLPGDLTLSVPGADYPSVANAAFPDTPAFELTAPAAPGSAGSVGIDTSFSWSGATNDAATIVTIQLASADFTTLVTCVAADTGSFALPAATVTELEGTFAGSVLSAGRTGLRVHTVGDARLILAVTRTRSYVVSMVPFDGRR